MSPENEHPPSLKQATLFVAPMAGRLRNLFSGFGAACLAALFLILMGPAANAQDQEPGGQALNELSNKALLAHGHDILNQAQGQLRSKVRGVARVEFLLDRMSETTLEKPLPEQNATSLSANTGGAEKNAETFAEAKAATETAQQRLDRQHERRDLLRQQTERLQEAQAAARELTDALERLEPLAHEIALRLADGSLPSADSPEDLSNTALAQHRERLARTQETLADQVQAANRQLEQLPDSIAKAEQALSAAQARQDAVQRRDKQELKRKGLEEEYQASNAEQLSSKLNQLLREKRWLQSALQWIEGKFTERQTQLEAHHKELASLDAKQAANADESNASQAMDDLPTLEKSAQHHLQRIRILRRQASGLEAFQRLGQSLESEASLLSEHLFRMRIVAELMQQDTGAPLGNSADSANIAKDSEQISALLTTTAGAIAGAESQMDEVKAELIKSSDAVRRIQRRISDLRLVEKTSPEDLEWIKQLQQQPSEELLKQFKSMTETLDTQAQGIHDLEEKAAQDDKALIETRDKLESLTDHTMRAAQQAALSNQRSIKGSFYDLAGLELPADSTPPPATPATGESGTDSALQTPEEAAQETGGSSQIPTSADSSEDRTASEPEADKPEPLAATENYRNLLASSIRVIEEREAQSLELHQRLTTLVETLKQQVESLSKAGRLAGRRHAAAIEIKRRIGLGDLASAQIPEGMADILKNTQQHDLQAKLLEALNGKTALEDELAGLGKGDKEAGAILKNLVETRDTVGKRLGQLTELTQLEEAFQLNIDELNEADRDRLERASAQRMAKEDKLQETLLGLLHSEDETAQTQLLHGHYRRVALLQQRLENLHEQKDKIKQIEELAEQERSLIPSLMELLQRQKDSLEHERLRQETILRARLAPEQAEDIIQGFEDKTGQSLDAAPVPVTQEEAAPLIETASGKLFNLDIRAEASRQWIQNFEQRLQPSGINREIGQVLDRGGNLDAEKAEILSQIQAETGHADLAEEATPTETPSNIPPTERLRYLEGEIGLIRADRLQQRSRAATGAAVQVAIILLCAVLLHWLSNRLVSRAIRRADNGGGEHTQTLFVLNFLRGFFRILIWVIAVVMILNSLGFNIAAVLAGLGIGGLAIAMAARESLANILSGITLFIERPFKIGDTIQVGSMNPGRVVNMTWRTTVMVDTVRYHYHVPNSKVADSTIKNYSRISPVLDYFKVYVSPEQDPHRVSDLMMQALDDCTLILHDEIKFIRLSGIEVFEGNTLMRYLPVWSCEDFSKRDGIRQEVWFNVWKRLTEAGISLRIKPYDGQLSEAALLAEQASQPSHASTE